MNSNILVVEDDPVTQHIIAQNLERAGHAVRCVSSVPQAEAEILYHLPDLVLLDWMLPQGTGIALAQRLRVDVRTREVPIIMLTARRQESDLVTGLDAGADDYITKPFSSRELLARVKVQLRRRAPETTDEVVEVAGLCIDPVQRRVSAVGSPVEMGDIEFRMLHYLATHPGRVFERGQLLDKLWGNQVSVLDRTVDAHIRSLRQALRPSGYDFLIETVRGVGYSFKRQPPAESVG